jgi:hypothetical protein
VTQISLLNLEDRLPPGPNFLYLGRPERRAASR